MRKTAKGVKMNDGGLPPRLVIAAPHGRSGKTTVSIAIGRALRDRGIRVQAFKKGPDFIDPTWLSLACGTTCRNLDEFLMGQKGVLASFSSWAEAAHIALVEGNMGFYDSVDAEGEASTAQMARLLRAPVILVVNAERMTRSVAALVAGYRDFEPDSNIMGIILNNVAGTRHEEKMREAIETYCKVPVLGAAPKRSKPELTERHLGLVPTVERSEAESIVAAIAQRIAPHLDLDAIIELANQAPTFRFTGSLRHESKPVTCRLGIIRDKAFSFYYPENLEALEQAGAELIFVDALSDTRLPPLDGLYIGGGFPELYLDELETNRDLLRSMATAIEAGMPTYAECGGLMYLCRAIRWRGRRYAMVGAIPADVELTTRPQSHGYVEAEVTGGDFFPMGLNIRGHEFHHSHLLAGEEFPFALTLTKGKGIDGSHDGILYRNVFASYMHLHALGTPEWAQCFIDRALRWQERQGGRKRRSRQHEGRGETWHCVRSAR